MSKDILTFTLKHFGEDTTDYFPEVTIWEKPTQNIFDRYRFSRYLMNMEENPFCDNIQNDFNFRLLVSPSFDSFSLYSVTTDNSNSEFIFKKYSQHEKSLAPETLLENKSISINDDMIFKFKEWVDYYDLWNHKNESSDYLDGTTIFIEIKNRVSHRVLIIRPPEDTPLLNSFNKLIDLIMPQEVKPPKKLSLISRIINRFKSNK